jgi:hypothetical protein
MFLCSVLRRIIRVGVYKLLCGCACVDSRHHTHTHMFVAYQLYPSVVREQFYRFSDRRDDIMSFPGTCCQCSCCGYHSSIVGHCYWFVQNCGANGWWPAGCEWRRHYRRQSSSEDGDRDEWPRFDHSDYENDRSDGRWNGGRDGGPRSSYRGAPMKLIFYWEKCCRRCDIPNAAVVPYSSARGVRRDSRDFVNGEKHTLGNGEWPIDDRVMVPTNLRRFDFFITML